MSQKLLSNDKKIGTLLTAMVPFVYYKEALTFIEEEYKGRNPFQCREMI